MQCPCSLEVDLLDVHTKLIRKSDPKWCFQEFLDKIEALCSRGLRLIFYFDCISGLFICFIDNEGKVEHYQEYHSVFNVS